MRKIRYAVATSLDGYIAGPNGEADWITGENRVQTENVKLGTLAWKLTNPATVTKLADRGSFQTVGLVTDVEPFLRVLVTELERGA